MKSLTFSNLPAELVEKIAFAVLEKEKDEKQNFKQLVKLSHVSKNWMRQIGQLEKLHRQCTSLKLISKCHLALDYNHFSWTDQLRRAWIHKMNIKLENQTENLHCMFHSKLMTNAFKRTECKCTRHCL